MENVKEAVFDYAFKRALQDLDALWDMAQNFDYEYIPNIRNARHALLAARPGRKTGAELRTPKIDPSKFESYQMAPFALEDGEISRTMVEAMQKRLPRAEFISQTMREIEALLEADKESPEGATPKAPKGLQESCGWCLGKVEIGTTHIPAGACEPCDVQAGPADGFRGSTFDPLGTMSITAMENQGREEVEKAGGLQGPLGASGDLDFTGDWVTADGAKMTMEWIDGWFGDNGNIGDLFFSYDKTGRCPDHPNLDLVERIREGKHSR